MTSKSMKTNILIAGGTTGVVTTSMAPTSTPPSTAPTSTASGGKYFDVMK